MSIILITISLLLFSLIIPLRYLLRSEIEQCRYRLFKIRDDLIYYVAENKLKENSLVFERYYTFTNEVINSFDKFKVQNTINQKNINRNIIKLLLSDNTDSGATKTLENIRLELSELDEDVNNTINEIYSVVIRITYTNGNFMTAMYILIRKYLGTSILKLIHKRPETIRVVQMAHREVKMLCLS